MRYGPVPDLQIRIMHLDREGSPPPGLRLPSRQVVTQFQSISSGSDSPVRTIHAQPRSRVCENTRLIPAVLRPVVFGPGRPENDRNWKER